MGIFGKSRRSSVGDAPAAGAGEQRTSLREQTRRASIDAAVNGSGLKSAVAGGDRKVLVASGKSSGMATPLTYEHSKVIKTNRRPSNDTAFREAERRIIDTNKEKLE